MKYLTGCYSKRLLKKVLIICALLVLIALAIRIENNISSGKKRVDVSSALLESINIAELSTAEFRYKGIADIYTNENRTDILCRECYNAVVKPYINVNEVIFETDENSKTIYATLPEIQLKVILVNEESMSLLPSDAIVEIDTMMKAAKEDAEREATESGTLLDTARDNFKSTIKALLYPILEENDYCLIWK